MLSWTLLAILVFPAFTLRTLNNTTLTPNYQIGLLQDLYFRTTNQVFFHCQNNLFGVISQSNGSLMAVYELQDGEYIVGFNNAVEVIIAKEKTINVFFPKSGSYQKQSFETTFLAKHPNFQRVIDFTRTQGLSVLILTDRYLMELPFTIDDLKYSRVVESILVQLTQEGEEFFRLRDFLNVKTNKLDYYLISLRPPNNATREMCFRTVGNLNQSARCIPIPALPIDDVVSTGPYIYVSFEEFTLVMTNMLEFLQKIDSLPLQYFRGMISLGDTHQYYDPSLRTIYSTKIIVERQDLLTQVRTMRVEQQQLIVESSDGGNATQVVRISKQKEENPRKIWSFTKNVNSPLFFSLYIEFADGRLIYYQVNGEAHTSQKMWQFLTYVTKEDINENEAADGV